MSCLECKSDSPGAIRFRVIEVHTLHIRDFNGERIIQSLGEFQDYEICTACALKVVRAFLHPAKILTQKSFPFVMLILAGVILTLILTLGDSWPVLPVKIIGPLSVIVGLSGIISKTREILKVREEISRMNHDEAMRFCAWSLVIKNAPKKYNDNDITYIPISKETLNMSPSQLCEKYNLLPAVASQMHLILSGCA